MQKGLYWRRRQGSLGIHMYINQCTSNRAIHEDSVILRNTRPFYLACVSVRLLAWVAYTHQANHPNPDEIDS